MELAGLAQGTPTTEVRRLAFAHVRHAGARQWAFVVEPWDSPPAWFDVPLIDLQPAVLKAATRELDATLGREPDAPPVELLSRAFAAAGEAVRQLSAGSHAELYRDCGAFAAGLLSTPSGVAFGWVGSSRVYRWRAGTLAQLSRDHTLGAEGGDVPSALRDVVVRQLASGNAEVRSADLAKGELLVLASAGVGDRVRRAPETLSTVEPVQALATHLLGEWTQPGVVALVVGRA